MSSGFVCIVFVCMLIVVASTLSWKNINLFTPNGYHRILSWEISLSWKRINLFTPNGYHKYYITKTRLSFNKVFYSLLKQSLILKQNAKTFQKPKH